MRSLHFQRARERQHSFDCDIALPAFEATDVVAVQISQGRNEDVRGFALLKGWVARGRHAP